MRPESWGGPKTSILAPASKFSRPGGWERFWHFFQVKAFANIAEELRNRYAIAYRPADFKADGHYRKITIAARRKGKKLNIRTRKGYYARLVSLASNSRRTNDAPG